MPDDRSPPALTQSQTLIYGASQFDMSSVRTGRTYRVFVFRPPLPPPPSGYPVMVVTDANLSFPIAATMAATFALSGKAAIVVGVGYPTDDFMQLVALRNRDLTPPTPLSGLRQSPGRPPPRPEDFGGAEDFYRFLVEELRPAIAAAHPVDADQQTLYGHSMGGLFTLGVLLTHPESFRNFVASSPSLFWNDRATFNDCPGFARKVRNGACAPRVLITLGADEQRVSQMLLPGASREQMKTLVREWRMVDNARDLAARLASIKGGTGYSVRFHAFDGEDHLTVLPASISRAMAFALRPSPAKRSWLNALLPSPNARPVDAQDPPPNGETSRIDGAWEITLSSPLGVQSSTLVLNTDGATLTGTAMTQDGVREIVRGKVEGQSVAWELSITQPVSMTLKFTGAVNGDRISGTVKAGAFLSFPFSGDRG